MRWQYFEHGSFVDYGPDINAMIEEAYHTKQSYVAWEENDGKQCRLAFNNNMEIVTGKPPREVRRHDHVRGNNK